MRWTMRTASRSSIATSSRATSCSRSRAPSCSTSASRRSPSRADGLATTAAFDQRKLTADGTSSARFITWPPSSWRASRRRANRIFAFGAVLYEMATGRKAFEGDSQASLIASILTSQPPPIVSADAQGNRGSAAGTRSHRRAMFAEETGRPWQTARDVTMELEWTAAGRGPPAPGEAQMTASIRAREACGVGTGRWRSRLAASLWLVTGRDRPATPPVHRRSAAGES